MNIDIYISKQPVARQIILTNIHKAIVETDKSVEAQIEPMMGREMIVYKARGMMKYGLSSMKNYMSLHLLPIYASQTLYSRYKALLNKAKFQKGCINFDNEVEMPLEIVTQLILDCSKIDLLKIREEYLNQKRIKSKK
jgi:hypothetical protein